LFSITRNQCINTVNRARETVELDAKRLLDERNSSSADHAVLAREDEEQLLEMIARVLEKTEQDVVWMKYVDGFSIKEIERILDIDSKSGARTILQRARKKLRRAYGRNIGPDKEFSS
jgi:RNA polymerase sigma factor (sigma-70 family)